MILYNNNIKIFKKYWCDEQYYAKVDAAVHTTNLM